MRPDKIIIRSQNAEIYDKDTAVLSSVIGTVLATVGVDTANQQYFTGPSSKLTHDFDKVLERPSHIRVSKVILPATIPTFNSSNNTIKLIRYNINDSTQNVAFELKFDLYTTNRNVFNTYAELAAEMTTKLQTATGNNNLSVSIDAQTGILTFVSTDAVWRICVAEKNLKFGFPYPFVAFFSSNTVGLYPVQLSQTRAIYIKSNIETNNYCSDGDTKILDVIPFQAQLNDSYGSFSYINNSNKFFKIQEVDYNKLELQLLDDDKNLMFLNNSNIVIELELLYNNNI